MKPVIVVWLEWPEKCFRIDAGALRRLRELAPKGARVVRVRSERSFLRELPRATHALVWNFRSEWFERAPNLKVLATPAAGREFVPEQGPKGVRIHFGHFHGAIMAESVQAFLFAWARGFFRPELKEFPWPRTELSDKCYRVAGTRAVIAGFGNVGRAIGRKLEENGVAVTGYTRHGLYFGAGEEDAPFSTRDRNVASPLHTSNKGHATFLSRDNKGDTTFFPCDNKGDATFLSREKRNFSTAFSRALFRADWLILALPSTTGTDNFLDAKLLAKLPRRAVVVNVGRGNAVDERALYNALASHRIAGAYLDVRCHEPSATVLEAPGYVPELTELPNCIVMPHASAFDAGYLTAFIDELAKEGCLK